MLSVSGSVSAFESEFFSGYGSLKWDGCGAFEAIENPRYPYSPGGSAVVMPLLQELLGHPAQAS